MEIKEIIENDKWTVHERTDEEGPVFIRYRNELKPDYEYSEYSEAIHIFWDFVPNEVGMPQDTSILERMEKFENDLVKAIESDFSGILVGVVTMSGYRQWLYCLKSEPEFFNRLNSIPLDGDEPYPLELEREDESGWKYFFKGIYQG